nr:uncharacterized protein LOC109172218 [Ipomoea batatas]
MRFAVAAWRTPRRRERRRGCLPSSPLLRRLATSRLRRGCRVTPPGRRDDVVAAPCSVKPPSTGEGSCWPEVLTPPAGLPSSPPERGGRKWQSVSTDWDPVGFGRLESNEADSGTNPSMEGGDVEDSKDPLRVIDGPLIRARAKRLQDTVGGMISARWDMDQSNGVKEWLVNLIGVRSEYN